MLLAAGLMYLLEPIKQVDTVLQPNKLEFDTGSYLYHWDRSEDWVEGFDNGYIGIQRSADQANLYFKAGIFTNSYGDFGGVVGAGHYYDDKGRFKQGIEGGVTWGYKDGEGSPVFLGYAGRFDISKTVKFKLHVNPMFMSANVGFNF